MQFPYVSLFSSLEAYLSQHKSQHGTAEEKSRCAVEDAKQLPFFLCSLMYFECWKRLMWVISDQSCRNLVDVWHRFLHVFWSGLLHQKTVIFGATYSRGSVCVEVNYSIICLTSLKIWNWWLIFSFFLKKKVKMCSPPDQ